MEAPILKQQSKVFQEGRMRRDSSRGLEGLGTVIHRPIIQQRIEEEHVVPETFTARVPTAERMGRSYVLLSTIQLHADELTAVTTGSNC